MKMKILSAALALAVGPVATSVSANDLADVYTLALENDPQLLRAAAERDAAKSAVDISRADWWPQIDFALSYSDRETDNVNWNDAGTAYSIVSSSGSSTGAEISLTQTLFNMRVWESTDIEEKRAYQAEVNYLLARQQLMLRVSEAYFTVLSAIDSLEFAQAEKRAIERQLEQTRHRFSLGLTAITDVHEAQAQYDNANAQEIQAQNGVEIALEGLREITGRQFTDVEVLNAETFSTSSPDPQGVENWIAQAHERNLELLIRRSGVEVADQQIDLARMGHYPTVSLTASYSDETSDSRGTSISGLNTQSIGIRASVPLYSGGRTLASTEQARNNYVAASQTLEESRRSVERSVRTAYFDVVAAVSSIQAFEQAVVSAESALNATQAGFEVGTRTIVDVLNSTRNLFNARRNLSEARYNYINRSLALQQASGIISERDLLSINEGLVAAE
ncbi:MULTISPECIES: outer membrane channel protein TolC [Gammaproteobacteria]|uniref:outer membrane channel protein TolC n=1 Tax=Gammaproteobacteria TaxID=1236 RepID=UPI000DD09A1A|nr:MULTISPECIES: outer membrane channel protein TolC [Gammaproteobacteria]RTE87693.1 outer membrane channel protein TolC [Aliidiomarina sp. B3213]TCZ92523.1 outer membrane channel protein TolC [Lysobacter sp. N42]